MSKAPTIWSWEDGLAAAPRTQVSLDGTPLATLVPLLPAFAPAPSNFVAGHPYVLSRFAHLRVDGGELVLESPLSRARIVLQDGRATVMVHALARPCLVDDLAARVPSIPLATAQALLALLLAASMAAPAAADGSCAADRGDALRSWEFHDLLFHTRSRGGRSGQPVGATFRFLGEIAPPPAIAPISPGPRVELFRPDLAALAATDPPLSRLQEERQSIRDYGARALSARQLGEFLHRVGRLADYGEDELPTPRGPVRLASAVRPYPSAGGLYELEVYALVNRCEGLAAGLYRHDADGHCLQRLPASATDLDALLADASLASMIPAEELQVLFVIAARFQRVAWKYSSIAYSLVLKNTGVLLQTMYLAATAMRLAPCALGCGNADLFARAAGVDVHTETSVGEFLLGSRRSMQPV